jgi:hypothetical protein
MADPAPDPAKPNPEVPPAQQGRGQDAAPKPMFQWIQEGPGGGVGVILGMSLIGLILAALGWIGLYIFRPGSIGSIDQSRSMLAIIFSIGTIATAFCLMLGAFLSAGTETVKDRFTLANQVLTPLIGIMGTILGFYFGTANDKKAAEPLAIVDVMVAKNTVKPGESLPITAIVSGGQGPWEFSLAFDNNALPAVRRKVASQNFRESIAIPAGQKGQLGVTVEVTDSAGATAKLERKVGEWVTIETAAPVTPEVIVPAVPRPMEPLMPIEPNRVPEPETPQPAPRPQDAPNPPPFNPST